MDGDGNLTIRNFCPGHARSSVLIAKPSQSRKITGLSSERLKVHHVILFILQPLSGDLGSAMKSGLCFWGNKQAAELKSGGLCFSRTRRYIGLKSRIKIKLDECNFLFSCHFLFCYCITAILFLDDFIQGREFTWISLDPWDQWTGGHQPHKSSTRDSYRSPSFLELFHARVLLNHVTIIKTNSDSNLYERYCIFCAIRCCNILLVRFLY